MTRGLDLYELLVANKEALSSTTPTLVVCVKKESSSSKSETSTTLDRTPTKTSRADKGTAILADDSVLALVLKFESKFSTLSCVGYMCKEENNTQLRKVFTISVGNFSELFHTLLTASIDVRICEEKSPRETSKCSAPDISVLAVFNTAAEDDSEEISSGFIVWRDNDDANAVMAEADDAE